MSDRYHLQNASYIRTMHSKFLPLCFLLFISCGSPRKIAGPVTMESPVQSTEFRVVGYIPARGAIRHFNQVGFTRLTHINIAFVNPDSTGNLVIPASMDSIIRAAHQHNVLVLASIGGGSHNPYYAKLLTNDYRAAFVEKLVRMVVHHQLDGLDVDLENEAIDSNYQLFITDLAAQLKPLKKLLTAALATWNAEKIPDSALNQFDFMNVMSYDQTGPWRPDKPGPHSTYEKAVEDLEYWRTKRNLAANRINLGVPFYGYGFGVPVESFSFKEILLNFPGSENKDSVARPDGGFIYYNGIPTMIKKTQLALDKTGGIMIWQLMQDDLGELSLLKSIDKTIRQSR
jgi:GH18 family chitinase